MYQASNPRIINTIVDLQSRGFYYDFCLVKDKLFCAQKNNFLREDEFNIIEMYSFQCHGKLRSETVIYGIECLQYYMKGILLNSIKKHTEELPSIVMKKISRFWPKYEPILID